MILCPFGLKIRKIVKQRYNFRSENTYLLRNFVGKGTAKNNKLRVN